MVGKLDSIEGVREVNSSTQGWNIAGDKYMRLLGSTLLQYFSEGFDGV
jgi:hypothetical protein